MGYDFTGGRISHFPIDFCMGLTTVQRKGAACDAVFVLCQLLWEIPESVASAYMTSCHLQSNYSSMGDPSTRLSRETHIWDQWRIQNCTRRQRLDAATISGKGSTDADDWAKNFKNYARICRVTLEFALRLLENRLTGTARQWLENQAGNLNFDQIINRFIRRFRMNEGRRNQLLATFRTHKQAKDEPVRQYLEYM